ncbi:hypothetical protein [Nocardioides sp. zg-DK7169]|uniref:hypothetical protein n=1 Tax=Nocardioides sp. zg-DK7169 TaxID=2736600 RepID=UPI001554A584|nr:hypothetical protein [Nocardioides sp. zg-DK7169]NPC97412.1 hypothetical protein [Nocardioides sp. zg-DK7169]
MSTHDAFSTISVRHTDGSREVHACARFLGIRDGYLFLEDGVPTDRAGMGIKTAQTHVLALADVAAVDIETHPDSDDNSETGLALESAGLLNLDGTVYAG